MTFCNHLVHGFFDRFAYGAHRYDDVFCIRCPNIIKWLVTSSCQLADLIHVINNAFRNSIVELIGSFSSLEEDIRVLSSSADYRVFRIQCSVTEFLYSIPVNQLLKVFIAEHFDLLDLVRSTESVKKVQERNASLDCRKMCDTAQVHNFLYRTGCQHCEPCLSAGHYVRVISEDTECMSRYTSRCHVEYARQQFACDLVHIRDHQKQTLRCGICGGQSSSCQ